MGKCVLCKKIRVKGGGAFFKVPQEQRRRSDWNRACGITFTANDVVCVEHFTSSNVIVGAKRLQLMPNSVPTLNIKAYSVYQSDDGAENVGLEFFSDEPLDLRVHTRSEVVKSGSAETTHNCVAHTNGATQTDPIVIQCTMKMEIAKLKAKNKKLLEENTKLKVQLYESASVMSFIKKIFTEGQTRIYNGHGAIFQMPYAFTLRPRAYRHLYEKGYPLPHVTTLQRWYRKINVQEGIISVALDFMRQIHELTPVEKVCVLAFDEMKVTESYEYEPTGDFVRKPANYVQVVMARGLWKSWKQPIFFDFDCKITVDVLYKIISALQTVGFPVVAMVCDMGSSNQKLWRDLGITPDHPWFTNPINPEEKVFAFADAPHLIKLIRNHFIDTGFIWKGRIITTRAIVDVIKHTSTSDMSITFKLSEEHLSVKGIASQKVKLATQLLSNTTANAILRCYSQGLDVVEAVETAELVQLVNDWFDVLNSSVNTFNYPGKEPFGLKVEKQMEILDRMSNFMSGVIIPGKQSLQQFQKGVLVSNNALKQLYAYIVEKFNFKYVVTRRLNQDVLEHFFGNIRSKGGLNDHPSPKEFRFRLREYILARNTESLQDTGNVEHDPTEWLNTSQPQLLCDVGSLEGEIEQPEVEQAGEEEQEVVEALSIGHVECDSDVLQDDALEYMAGYIIRKQHLSDHEDTNNASFTWVDQVSKGFLRKPSASFVDGVRNLESVFLAMNSANIMHCKNIRQRLFDKAAHVNLPDSVKRFFFKCRVFFRMRHLNKQLKVKKAKNKVLRCKKLNKITL